MVDTIIAGSSTVDEYWQLASIVDWDEDAPEPIVRVAQGILYLDKFYPDALSKVDLDQLSIASCGRCVLGQIHGDYCCAPEFDLGMTMEWAQAHGFAHLWGHATSAMDQVALDKAWRLALAAYRNTGGE